MARDHPFSRRSDSMDAACLLPREHLVRRLRIAARRAERFGDGADAGSQGRFGRDAGHRVLQLARGDRRVIENDRRVKLARAGRQRGLVGAQRQADEGHFGSDQPADAVHAGMRDGGGGVPQDLALGHVGAHDEIGRQLPRGHVDAVGRHHDEAVPRGERGDERVGQRRGALAEHGAQRDVEHAATGQAFEREVRRLAARVHRRPDETVRRVGLRQLAREQARGVDEVEVARVEDPVAVIRRWLDAEAAADVGGSLPKDGVALRVRRRHRMRGWLVALDEGAQAGEHRVRRHGRELRQPRDRPGEGERCRVRQVAEAAVLGLREDVGKRVGTARQDVQHRGTPARRARLLEHVEIVRVGLERGAGGLDALAERLRREMGDALAALDERVDEPQRRVDVAVRGRVEEEDVGHGISCNCGGSLSWIARAFRRLAGG